MRRITRPFFTFLILSFATLYGAAQGVTTPRPSPAAELKQTIGLTKITVHYSRPQVIRNGNDRTGQIWGQLVPYGFNKTSFGGQGEIPWRAGANENTIIAFTHDVRVEGKPLAAGKYGLHMAIYEDGRATVIFSENTTSWGSFWYKPEEDVLRVDVQTEEIPFTNILTYEFVDLGNDYGVLALDWEKKRIPMKIEVDLHDQVLASMRGELRGVAGFGWQGPLAAANYCLQNNINHEEALQWADMAVNNSGGSAQTLAVKAGLLMQTGEKEKAAGIAEKAAESANVNQLNQLGYVMLQGGQTDMAIKFFKLNIERNPEVANCYDSLGEAYMAAGEKEKAIEAFKTSLSKNPPPFVKANSIKNLKTLGVEYEQ
jgi:tetratricopeptide (TPR) repeat protein